MNRIELVPGVVSTRIGFGCAGLMQEPSARKRQKLLSKAFDQGISHFDVARMYGLGAAEKELGRFVQGRRDDIVIATKFGIEPRGGSGPLARLQGPARWLLARYPGLRRQVKGKSDAFHKPRHYDAATARTSLETSLRELRTDHVDLMLIHDPSPADHVDLVGICSYMEEARQAGLLRGWGIAGEPDPCLGIKRSLPETAILQVRDDILSRSGSAADGLEPLITFGVLSKALDQITGRIGSSPERRSQWSEALGMDCSPSALASLLMRDAIDANRRGVVLFSTTRPERLEGLGAISEGAQDGTDPVLEEFRRRVIDEMAPSN